MGNGNKRRLRPTLWRTCRTLANRSRLKLFCFLLSHPGSSVTEIAVELKMHPALASQFLRELNARGLLLATRHAARVFYRVGADRSVPQASALVEALTEAFHHERDPLGVIYRKVTAFTHPRRIAIVGRLRQGPARFAELSRQLGISPSALKRHLHKLASRGFLQAGGDRGVYAIARNGSPLEMALRKLV